MRFTKQSLCEDIFIRRMQTLGHLRMKCWEEYLDQGGIMIGWSVCKDSEQLNKSFSYLLWSYWALSLLKYCPPLFIHCSHCFFQFWKHSSNASFGIMSSSASIFSLISLTDQNCHPFSMNYSMLQR